MDAQITCLGDLRCPDCGSIIQTPVEDGRLAWIKPGHVRCPVCERKIRVTSALARRANKRLDASTNEGLEEIIRGLMEEDA